MEEVEKKHINQKTSSGLFDHTLLAKGEEDLLERINNPNFKRCHRCRKYQPLHDFTRRGRMLTGEEDTSMERNATCIHCLFADDAKKMEVTPLEAKIQSRVTACHRRSMERKVPEGLEGIDVDIAVKKWIEQGGTSEEGALCAICGKRVSWMPSSPYAYKAKWDLAMDKLQNGAFRALIASIDRIDASDDRKPYYNSQTGECNFRWVCNSDNSAKGAMDIVSKIQKELEESMNRELVLQTEYMKLVAQLKGQTLETLTVGEPPEDVTLLRSEHFLLHQQNQNLLSQMNHLQEQNKRMKEKISDLESQYYQRSDRIEEKDKEVSQKEKRIAFLIKELNKMRTLDSENKVTVSVQAKTLKQQTEKIENLENIIKKKDVQLKKYQDAIDRMRMRTAIHNTLITEEEIPMENDEEEEDDEVGDSLREILSDPLLQKTPARSSMWQDLEEKKKEDDIESIPKKKQKTKKSTGIKLKPLLNIDINNRKCSVIPREIESRPDVSSV